MTDLFDLDPLPEPETDLFALDPLPAPVVEPPPLLRPIKIVDYDKTTGEILRTVMYPFPLEAETLYPDCLYLPAETDTNDVRRYVDVITKGLVTKLNQGSRLDGMTLKDVRAGAKVLINSVQVSAADGSDIPLELPLPGVYTVTVKDWPYLDWNIDVEVPAQQVP